MSDNKPPVWRMVKEAIKEIGSPTTTAAVREWILAKYPGTNPSTISCQIAVCTVNISSRLHYPENAKPREATSQYDFLYRVDRGQLEWYEPVKHGLWRIVLAEDGILQVASDLAECTKLVDKSDIDNGFAAEAHLRDYLARHLTQIEDGLTLFTEDDRDGVEFVTDVGRIDILAIDKTGSLVIIELKVGQAPDEVSGQLLRYMGWIRRHKANGHKVRGIIIGQAIGDKVRYAVADVDGVELREYDLVLNLRNVPSL